MSVAEPPTIPIRILGVITAPTAVIPILAAAVRRPNTIRNRIDLTVLRARNLLRNPPWHIHDREVTEGRVIRNNHSGDKYQAWEHKCVRCGHTKITYTAVPNPEEL